MKIYFRDQSDRVRVWRSDWGHDTFVDVTHDTFDRIMEVCTLLSIATEDVQGED